MMEHGDKALTDMQENNNLKLEKDTRTQ
ncbi:hypothetical protein TpMuguga_04g00743 [Theileria parva strain Muguga]|uniref:Uncharacterized protein n=1 Tax=Theileria parva TaxID=5875 RepID=Q4N113_THEPA|nr:hypothetical protein TpMuguga_04g00743 [Theileria parva strain Muguga]